MLPFEHNMLPFRASYGVSFMSTSTEIDRVIKGFYSIVLALLTTWLKCGKRVMRKISNAGSRVSIGPYHGPELPITG